MDHLRRFFRLPAGERFFLFRALSLLAATRIALWLLPFRVVQRISPKVDRACSAFQKRSEFSRDRGIWAIQVASRYVPRASCLTQALATQALLGFSRIPTSVRIGVAKSKAGNFEAHAWLESDGEILMGGADANQRYTRLLSFGSGER
jgi:hypothetical protein